MIWPSINIKVQAFLNKNLKSIPCNWQWGIYQISLIIDSTDLPEKAM
jgi:hypothetical protein